jgi:heme/copper-type cytochrome/quinol oxidase subunit 3
MDAEPLAIAHMPGPTYAPFTMAVAFLALFAGALVEESLLLLLGVAIAAVALFLWFRPQHSEALALEELGDREPGQERLPLAIGGRIANGWWATLVFLAVLATALLTIVASYFYLGDGAGVGSEPAPGILVPGLVALLSLAAVGSAFWAIQGVRRRAPGGIRLGLMFTWLLSATALGLGIYTFPWDTLEPQRSAYASGVLGVVGFQWLVLAILLTVVTIALMWAIGKPLDRRGHSVVHNVGLIAGFTGASAAVVFAVVHLSPRLW